MIQITFVNEHGEIRQWCSPAYDDMYTTGSQYNGLTAVAVANDLDLVEFAKTNVYINGAWTARPPQPTRFHQWISGSWVFNQTQFDGALRAERNRRLFECDWTQFPDSPLTDEKKTQWQTYRRALRDLPVVNEATTWEGIQWPLQP